jgi:molecular chaperone DnaJ
VILNPCSECSGDGRVRARRAITVSIPPGVDVGTRIQLPGDGEVGPGGGPAGDLYVEVDVAPHSIFTRDGDDLLCAVTVPMTAAALGTTVELPTLEADLADASSEIERTVPLEIRPGTQSGERLVLRASGVPRLRGNGRGDIVTTVVVETPTKVDDAQAEVLRQLAALRGEEQPTVEVESRHRSVFDRFKDALGGR